MLPVHVGGVDIRSPSFCGCGSLVGVQTSKVGILVVEEAWQVAVVVRTRVGGIVPVQGGIAVHSGPVKEGGIQVEIVGRLALVLEDEDRLEGRTDPCVADFALLVTPVRVVHVVLHQVIDLLRGSILGTSFSRCRESEEGESVPVIELFLGSCIVGERTVIDTLHPVVSSQTGRNVEGIGPAVVKHSGGVVGHQTQPVQGAVGKNAETPSRTHAGRIAENVGHTVVASCPDRVVFEAVGDLLAAHGFIEAAPQGIWRISSDRIVEPDACEQDILGLGIVAPVLEADVTESVADDVVVRIVRSVEDRRIVRIARIIHVEFGEACVIDVRDHLLGDKGHEYEIPHEAFHRHIHDGRSETFGEDFHRVLSVRYRVDCE